ncbi:MAG: hypothetical protein D6788_04255 [Planctomycetota bacterium]|nr:MAG: hypothetical protein D6788_04255 [Planctomycetota bacterium]
MTSDPLRAYERAFAESVGTAHAVSFWKGRVALYAILKALGVGPGDEVAVTGYTCVMAVNPILYLGARPVYIDIEPETFNMDAASLRERISERTRLVIVQHTYGYPADLDALTKAAAERNLSIVEDCCLALGSRYRGRPVGTFGAAAYWSSQWSKSYTTGLGGMATTGDPMLAQRIRGVWEEASEAGGAAVVMLRMQLAAYRMLVFPRTTSLAQRIFRWLTRAGLVIGSSTTEEFSPVMPEGFLRRMSRFQAKVGLRQLDRFERSADHRRRLKRFYDERLAEAGWRVPGIRPECDPVLVRYPVRVRDKAAALQAAARSGVELGSWFESPLHPIQTPLEAFGYVEGCCPEAERAARETVNLPLHPRVSEAAARRSVELVCRIGPPDDSR